MLDSFTPAAWVERALTRIVSEGLGEIALVILNDEPSDQVPVGKRSLQLRAAAWYRNRHTLAYSLYQRFDARRYGSDSDPTRERDVSGLLLGAPVIRVRPRMTRFSDYFGDSDIAQILTYDLDVALRFGFRILKGDALRIARHGVWSFHHGDNRINRGGPAGFWEVVERHDATGAVLQRLTEALDAGEVLGRSFASTNRFSPTANRANYYWQAVEVLVGRLRELALTSADTGGGSFAEEPGMTWSSYSNRLYLKPNTMEMITAARRLAVRLFVSKIRSLAMREQWFIAYHLTSARGQAGMVPNGVFYRFKELVPPDDRFWADPFPVHTNGKHFIFFEEKVRAQPNAHISVVEIDSAGVVSAPRIVLTRPYHLSYPAVFEWANDWYMTPETGQRRAVELFRAESFPDKWVFVGNLLSDIDAVDPTIACIAGRWWMFVGVAPHGTTEATALHIFSAPTPLGPWIPHRRNPVKVDVRGARPGGCVFEMDGRYYRVGQDGAPSYGSGMRVFVIDQLDDNGYGETEVSHIVARWRAGLVGTHTLNASGGLTAIDARHVRFRTP